MEAFSIISTVFSVFGALQGGRQQAQQYEAQAKVARYNADLARMKAANVTSVTNQKEEQQRRAARFIIGRQRAAGAQSGTGLGGSTADMEEQSTIMAELDSLNIRYQGSLESQGLLSEAALADNEAEMAKYGARSAKSGSYLTAATSALSGAANYMSMTAPSGVRPTVKG